MKYDWILFDADNTLMDFTKASEKAFAQALQNLNIPKKPDYFSRYKKVNHEVWTAFEKGEIDASTLRSKRFELFLIDIQIERDPRLFNTFYLNNLVEHTTLYEGALGMLEYLKGKTKLGLITNGLKEVQRPRLHHTGIYHLFDSIVVSDEIGVAKPDPAYFDYAFREMNHPPKEKVLVVGDNLHSDIKGGINYGLDTCWFNPDKQENTTAIFPTFMAQSFAEVLAGTK